MAYASNYYNYQVGVIFAILVGALLLLGLVVGAIYYICVVNMQDKKGRARTPSTIRQPRTGYYPQPQQPGVPYSSLHSPAVQPQPADYGPRSPGYPAQYPAQYTAQYNQQPLVQQYSSDMSGGAKIRELQPEFTYQQGPVTYTTMSPVQDGPYPVSPGPAAGGTYHMSSV